MQRYRILKTLPNDLYNNKEEDDYLIIVDSFLDIFLYLCGMKQRERIEEMEKHFECVSEVVARLSDALDDFAKVQESVKALEAYYGSKEWKKDFRDDEKGLFPTDLKRGVLSEDGIWNLLEDIRALKERMQDLSK